MYILNYIFSNSELNNNKFYGQLPESLFSIYKLSSL